MNTRFFDDIEAQNGAATADDDAANERETPLCGHAAALFVLTPNALYEAINAAKNLDKQGIHSTPLAILTAIAAGAASYGYNEEMTVENTKDLYVIMRGKRPNEWAVISVPKTVLTVVLSMLPIVATMGLHAIQIYFMAESFPEEYLNLDLFSKLLVGIGISAASIAAIAFFLAQCMETYTTIRNFIAGIKATYTNPLSQAITPYASTLIASLGMLSDYTNIYSVEKDSVQIIADRYDGSPINMAAAVYPFAIGALLISITTYCYNKAFSSEFIDRLVNDLIAMRDEIKDKRLSSTRCIQIFSFTLSSTLSILLTLLAHESNYDNTQEVLMDYHVQEVITNDTHLDALTQTFTALMTLYNVIMINASLYDPIYNLNNLFMKKSLALVEGLQSLYSHLTAYFVTENAREKEATVPLLLNEETTEIQIAEPTQKSERSDHFRLFRLPLLLTKRQVNSPEKEQEPSSEILPIKSNDIWRCNLY